MPPPLQRRAGRAAALTSSSSSSSRRFPTDCFNLTYRAQHDNSDYLSTATADTGGKDLTTKEHFTVPITTDPRVYLEPALGGVSFFERVEVSVNGMPVKAHEFGPFHYVYQTLNRTFTTRGNRDKKYGGDIARTHTGLDRMPGISDTVKEVPKDKRELREAMKTLQHDAVKTSADLESHFTFDVSSHCRTAAAAAASTAAHLSVSPRRACGRSTRRATCSCPPPRRGRRRAGCPRASSSTSPCTRGSP